MSNYTRILGAKLRTARRSRGLSLQALQTLTGGEFKMSAVGAYERGERALTVEKLDRLCTIYGVHPISVIPNA